MNEIEFLKQAAGPAGEAPPVDVRASVIRSLQTARPDEPKSSLALTGASVIVALVLGLWAWHAVSDVQNSLGSLAAPIEVHIQ